MPFFGATRSTIPVGFTLGAVCGGLIGFAASRESRTDTPPPVVNDLRERIWFYYEDGPRLSFTADGAVVVVDDGGDDGLRLGVEEVLCAALKGEARVYLSSPYDRGLINRFEASQIAFDWDKLVGLLKGCETTSQLRL